MRNTFTFRFIGIFLTMSLFGVLLSCGKNNPDPSWIEVNEWTLENNPDLNFEEGQITHNVSNAMVFVNNKNIGTFEVPFKVPVLVSGDANIKIYPVILNNGISATKKIYPFLEHYEINQTLVQNEVISLSPVTRYFAGCNFWIEDFDAAVSTVDNDPTSLVQMNTTNDPAIIQPFNGNKFARIPLDETNNKWIGYTTSHLNLPKGKEVYLEIDYHNTNRLLTGVLGIGPSGVKPNPYIQLNPQNDGEVVWKKIYIDLREIVSNSPEAEYFEISFESLIDDGASLGEINIDNLKIIHF